MGSGGGPLLLLFNGSVFIIGQIWIIIVEFYIHYKKLKASKYVIFFDVLISTIFSTIVIAFGLPLIIALISLIGNFFPGVLGDIIISTGTWVFEGTVFNRYAIIISIIWYVVLFVITVYFEAWILRKRWMRRNFIPTIEPIKLSWLCNSFSHFGLLLGIFIIWNELFFPG